MGLLDFFKKSNNKAEENKNTEELDKADFVAKESTKETPKETPKEQKAVDNTQKSETGFVLGVMDTFKLIDSKDLVIVGNVKGTVHVGDAVYCANQGDDEGGMFLTTILGIEINAKQPVNEAADCHVGLKLENAAEAGIKIGTVLFTREKSTSEVHDAYISALGDTYVMSKGLNLTDEELENLSVTDLSEIWRMFAWFHGKNKEHEDEDKRADNRKKIERIAAVICKKLLVLNEIYYLYNKQTGEPHMFSRTVKREEGYLCTPPDIMLITKAYQPVMEKYYAGDRFELRKIENGEDGKGIYNFLGSTFYLNGACGIEVNSAEVSVDASMLVPKPDYSGIPEINIPVTNPDVERWMLLIGQMNSPETEDEKLIYKLYYGFMSSEMVKAKFLIPMQKDPAQTETPDENGKVTLKKDTTINFPTMDGKYGRPAVRMFTDWKRLRMAFPDEKWGGMIQPISGFINAMDCAINATQFPKAGDYVGEEMYKDMEELAKKKQGQDKSPQ